MWLNKGKQKFRFTYAHPHAWIKQCPQCYFIRKDECVNAENKMTKNKKERHNLMEKSWSWSIPLVSKHDLEKRLGSSECNLIYDVDNYAQSQEWHKEFYYLGCPPLSAKFNVFSQMCGTLQSAGIERKWGFYA